MYIRPRPEELSGGHLAVVYEVVRSEGTDIGLTASSPCKSISRVSLRMDMKDSSAAKNKRANARGEHDGRGKGWRDDGTRRAMIIDSDLPPETDSKKHLFIRHKIKV